jgi:hypothetical protein
MKLFVAPESTKLMASWPSNYVATSNSYLMGEICLFEITKFASYKHVSFLTL